jgi:hypothetical protein
VSIDAIASFNQAWGSLGKLKNASDMGFNDGKDKHFFSKDFFFSNRACDLTLIPSMFW